MLRSLVGSEMCIRDSFYVSATDLAGDTKVKVKTSRLIVR